ncbi:succinoglycan biosynthesis protein exov [Vibrio kanaloae]|uniref:polysaccharide pyruvyl transferase family protein n=1 Tax=Vibrio kanaloae TaxID=170673 RepID=UPI000C85B18E|nr:polysaccharide pyruvyl transferase family protein [Vibrio kanaloae]KAB0460995.1 polysaccharide pyruvyl transferase family protein [Vibrio kanaloae]PMM01497.1 succinoglycan biosynthesis protein exov [Vibrio kanaloae]
MAFKLEYCLSDTYNVGDDLNPWLWPQLFGDLIVEDSSRYFLGIGTILTEKRLNKTLSGADEVIIFSSGAWEWNVPKLSDKCAVYGVRGPRTAKKLGLKPELVVGDGAYLLREVDFPKAEIQKGKIGFIPHHRSEDFIDWDKVCQKIGLTYITAKQPVETFLLALQECESVVTEAMHGAIIADALRIPWKGVRFSPAFDDEKWYDFAESMDVELILHDLPFISVNKMPIGKLLENTFKRNVAKLFKSSSRKWLSLVTVYKLASNDDMKNLQLKLKVLANDKSNYQLSSLAQLNAIVEIQKEVISKIIKDQN